MATTRPFHRYKNFNREAEFVTVKRVNELPPGTPIDKTLFNTRRLRHLYMNRRIEMVDVAGNGRIGERPDDADQGEAIGGFVPVYDMEQVGVAWWYITKDGVRTGKALRKTEAQEVLATFRQA